jgi:hypothetical protein
MRHLRSILYALVLAPSIWILAGVGFTHDLTSRGREFFAEESIAGLLLLIFAGILYAILTFAPVSPAGPALTGAAYLGVTIYAWNSPAAYAGLWAPEITKDTFDLSRPGYGLAALLAIPLLGTALSARRWARYEPPVLPIIGEIGRFRGKAAVAGAAPLSIAETTVIRPGRPHASPSSPAGPGVGAGSLGAGSLGAGADHTVAIPSADRTVAMPGADRTMAVPAGDRTVSFPTNDRTVAFPTDDQTIAVPAADATVAITGLTKPTSPAPSPAAPAPAAAAAPTAAPGAAAAAAKPTVTAPREDTTMLFPAATAKAAVPAGPAVAAAQATVPAGPAVVAQAAVPAAKPAEPEPAGSPKAAPQAKPSTDEETHRLGREDIAPSKPVVPSKPETVPAPKPEDQPTALIPAQRSAPAAES